MAAPRVMSPALRALDCEGCGAPLMFDPAVEKTTCPHCGYVPQEAADGSELLEMLERARASHAAKAWDHSTFSCSECGAHVLAPLNDKTVTCAFCGSSHLGTLAASSDNALPDFVAVAGCTLADSAAIVMAALRGPELRRDLGSVRPVLVRRLIRYGVADAQCSALMPLYRFTVKARVRGKTNRNDTLPALVALDGVHALATEVSGHGDHHRLAAKLATGSRLDPWGEELPMILLASDIDPRDALAAIRSRLPALLGKALNRYLKQSDKQEKVGRLEERVVGIDYAVIAIPVHIVQVSGGGQTARFIVNASSGEVIGPPGRRPRQVARHGAALPRMPKSASALSRPLATVADWQGAHGRGQDFWTKLFIPSGMVAIGGFVAGFQLTPLPILSIVSFCVGLVAGTLAFVSMLFIRRQDG